MTKDDFENKFAARLAEARAKYANIPVETSGDVPFVRALREYIMGNLSVDTRNLSSYTAMRCAGIGTQAGIGLMYPIETRGISVSGTNGVTVNEEVFDLLGAIRNKLVLNIAGARMLTGLKGDVSFAAYSGSVVRWANETEAAKDGKGDFLKKVLKPKRLTSYVDISKQMLLQSNEQLDKFIMNDFAQAIASSLQAAVLGGHDHSEIKPDGIFTDASLKITGEADFKRIIGLQSEVYPDALSYCYITNNKGCSTLKGRLKETGVAEGFIVERDKDTNTLMCADYPLYQTNDIPDIDGEHGIAFGDFSELIIGQWGDLDITVDPYTKATDGEIRLVVNTFFDAMVRRDGAIAVGTLV